MRCEAEGSECKIQALPWAGSQNNELQFLYWASFGCKWQKYNKNWLRQKEEGTRRILMEYPSKPWKRRDSFGPTGKSEWGRSFSVFHLSFEFWLYFLPQQSDFLYALGNKATKNLHASHPVASAPGGNCFIIFLIARLRPTGRGFQCLPRAIPINHDSHREGCHDWLVLGRYPHGITKW